MLHLIDRLAGWWFDRRNDQLIKHHPEWKEFGIEKFDFDASAGTWDLTMTSSVAAVVLADNLAKFLQSHDAENYVEFNMLPRPDRRLPPIRVTVQWAKGMSLAQKATWLEKKVKELEKKIAELDADTNLNSDDG